MLFQPTNIIPDVKGAFGNGTIDTADGLAVSWQVNGNTPMTAFSITIYTNDALSTQKYTTGKLTSGCPFDPSDWQGVPQTFTHTITAATLSSAGITNGNEYKLVIQQWWSVSDSITQTSASVFLTRANPTLTLTVSSPVTTKEATFNATYTQANGDPLSWVRWMAAYADDLANPFYDTGARYTNVTQTSLDGLFTGYTYAVRCMVETSNGINADTGWVQFDVEYPTVTADGVFKASCDYYGSVFLEWSAINYIVGTGSGYSIADNVLSIENGGSVTWDEVNGSPMNLPVPWSFLWNGSLVTLGSDDASGLQGANIFTLETTEETIECVYSTTTKNITVSIAGDVVGTVSGVRHNPTNIWILLTPTKLYIRSESVNYVGMLTPSETLYPGNTVYPATGTPTPIVQKLTETLDYTQGNIQSVTLGGIQRCNYVQILTAEATESLVTAILDMGVYTPTFDKNTQFLADFSNGLSAGNIQTSEPITGYAVYRQKGTDAILKRIANTAISTTQMWDFSVESREGDYTYYMFPIGASTYVADPLVSASVSVCLGAWTLLSCQQDPSDSAVYTVEKAFSFGKNLETVNVSNNNSTNVLLNFTRYPTVQKAAQNYQSGTLGSLIGAIGFDENGKFGYWNTKKMRDEIFNLSTTSNTLFLRSMLGDCMMVAIEGAIGMATENDPVLSTTVSLPWVEIGDVKDVSVVSYAGRQITVN